MSCFIPPRSATCTRSTGTRAQNSPRVPPGEQLARDVHILSRPSPGESRERMEENHLRILLVEDEPQLQRVLMRYMERFPARVTPSSDAPSALGHLARQEYDVLVADVGLPGESGLDLLAHVKLDWPALPVVLMTGSGDVAT